MEPGFCNRHPLWIFVQTHYTTEFKNVGVKGYAINEVMFYLDPLKIHSRKRWRIELVSIYEIYFDLNFTKFPTLLAEVGGGRDGSKSETPFEVTSQIVDFQI